MIMREHNIFDWFVSDGANFFDNLLGHHRSGLRIHHHHTIVANDHARVGVTLCREGIEIAADLREADFLCSHVTM